jgi:hypothetical protein
MPCCPAKIIPFSHASQSVISYGDTLRNVYGNNPSVEVWYWDYSEMKYIQQGVFTEIKMSGYPLINQITIDHGGDSSGLIKIS